MSLVLADRVQQTATAVGTTAFTLTGTVTGFQSFAVIGNGNTTYCSAFDASGNWEVSICSYSTTGPTLTRTTILSSSNSGSAVTFSGTVAVLLTYPSGKSVNLNASGDVSALGTVSSGVWQGSAVGTAYGGTGLSSVTAGYVPYGNGTSALSTSANLTFSGSNLTVGGTVSASNGASGGFYTSTYATNTSNNIWAFGNATNYGLKYFQGTAGTAINGGYSDTIAMPFGQTTAGASFFQFVGNGSNLGALVLPKQPLFKAGLTNNGDQTYTNSVLPFNISVIDKTGNFDTGTYTYTAPIAGTYFFAVQTYGTASAGNATMANQIQVNGTAVSPVNGDIYIGAASGQVAIAPIQSSVTIALAAGDTVRVYGTAYNVSAIYRIYTGASIFTGWLVG